MSTSTQPIELLDDIDYPSSDGLPMAETPLHVKTIINLYSIIEKLLADKPDDYFQSNSFWYYEKNNPKARRAPDLMLVRGVGQQLRNSFLAWREGGAVPRLIFEICSKNKWENDLYDKKDLYERLGVFEYFVFDPQAKFVRPPLKGWRLDDYGVYQPILPDDQQRLYCQELNVYLFREGIYIRFQDADTGELILTPQETAEQQELLAKLERRRAKQERQRAKEERQRANEQQLRAEKERQRAEKQQLRAEKADRKAQKEHEKAEAEKLRAEAAERAAESERLRVQELLAEIARLKAGQTP